MIWAVDSTFMKILIRIPVIAGITEWFKALLYYGTLQPNRITAQRLHQFLLHEKTI